MCDVSRFRLQCRDVVCGKVLAANAVSAALVMSGVPWAGPVGVVRVAMCEGELVVNPSGSQLGSSEWSMLYGGTAEDCVLVAAAPCAGFCLICPTGVSCYMPVTAAVVLS